MLISFDLETALIQPGNLQPKPIVASVALPGRAPYLMAPSDAAAWLSIELSAGATAVGQHIQFDMGVLVAHFPAVTDAVFAAYSRGLIRDTRIREQLLDISTGTLGYSGYSLADLEKKYLGRDRSAEKTGPEVWRLRYAELDGVPLEQWPQEAKDYALADAQGTLEVYEAQARRIGAAGLAGEALITRSAFALHLMSCRGLITDAEAVQRLKVELEVAKAALFPRLRRAGLYHLSGSKKAVAEGRGKWSKDMGAIKTAVQKFYKKKRLTVPLTDKGAVSTDRDTLDRSGSRVLKALARVGYLDKLITTYVPILERGATAALMPSYGLAETGRTTCSGGREGPDGIPLGFNCQNMPRGDPKNPKDPANQVREAFVPRPGFLFCSTDYDGAELRGLANVCLWLFGKSVLADELRAKKDPLMAFGARTLNISYEEAKARGKADALVKKRRDFGKVFLYGKAGGLGIRTLREYARTTYGIEMSEAEARTYDRVYFQGYPEMRRYFDYIGALTERTNTIKGFGTGMVRGGVTYTSACNFLFQNLVAQGARDAVFQVLWECYVDHGTALYGSFPVAFIHDELILEVPIATAHEASMRLAEVMCNSMSQYIQDVPVTASPALMDRWRKGAEPVYDSVGRLVPWFPAKSV